MTADPFEGMAAGDCASAARAAEEEYDYERALAGWRMAVQRSRGDRAMVAELVRFLADVYADFAEIAEVLGSPGFDIARSPELHGRLADALFQLGRGAEARAEYERLAERAADSATLWRLGLLAEQAGDLQAADGWLARAVQADHGRVEARELLAKVRAQRGDQARQVAAQREDTTAEAARGALARAESAADAGDWRAAKEALREAGQHSEAVAQQAADLRGRIDAALAEAECAEHLERGRQRMAEGERLGGLLEWSRALATGVPVRGDEPLLQRIVALAARGRPTERQLEGLLELVDAEALLAAGQVDQAHSLGQRARRHLKGDPGIRALEKRIEEARRQERRRRAEVEASQAASRKAEKEAAAKAGALEARQRRIDRLVEAREWFDVRREADDDADLTARAEEGIASDWAVVAAPSSGGAGGGLALSELGFEEGFDGLVELLGGRVVVAAGQRLAVVDPDGLAPVAVIRLPEMLAIDRRTTRLFAAGQDLLIVDAASRTLTRVSPAASAVLDRISLGRSLPRDLDAEQVARETQYDEASERLLVLLTGQRGRNKARLLSIALEDGRTRDEEAFSYPAFALRHIGGTREYTVQRRLELHRLSRSMHNFAVVDARARIGERPFYADIEPMHAIKRIARVDGLVAPIFCQYWFLEPFTGQVLDASNGFAQLKDDWSIYYQTADPTSWLGGEASLVGEFAVHEPSESLAFVTRALRDDATGVAGFSLDRLRKSWQLDAPDGTTLHRLLEDRAGGRLLALTTDQRGLVIRGVDPDEKRLL